MMAVESNDEFAVCFGKGRNVAGAVEAISDLFYGNMVRLLLVQIQGKKSTRLLDF